MAFLWGRRARALRRSNGVRVIAKEGLRPGPGRGQSPFRISCLLVAGSDQTLRCRRVLIRERAVVGPVPRMPFRCHRVTSAYDTGHERRLRRQAPKRGRDAPVLGIRGRPLHGTGGEARSSWFDEAGSAMRYSRERGLRGCGNGPADPDRTGSCVPGMRCRAGEGTVPGSFASGGVVGRRTERRSAAGDGWPVVVR